MEGCMRRTTDKGGLSLSPKGLHLYSLESFLNTACSCARLLTLRVPLSPTPQGLSQSGVLIKRTGWYLAGSVLTYSTRGLEWLGQWEWAPVHRP